jgi:serine/threonine-protein kinase
VETEMTITQELAVEIAPEQRFRVGRYILERPLGAGGMAEVWLGRHVHLGTPVAVKFLSQSYAGIGEIEERFLNEGKRQGALNHPNIVKVYGFEYAGNRSFLILQLINGESLDDLLRRTGRMEPTEAVTMAVVALNALDYAHEHNIVHRDVKPSNILLDENRVPYLGDFGIVFATNEKRLTRPGTAMGTALYMSPEQIREPGSVDRRSDIYSFGCVLYEMLTGAPPFNPAGNGDGDTDFAIKLAQVQQAPPPLRMKNPALSPRLEAVVMRCLAKNPAERYSTCRELRDALRAAMATGTVIENPRVDWIACANCRRMIQPGVETCPYCNPVFVDVNKLVHKAWLFGILGLPIAVVGRIVAGRHWSGSGSTLFGAIVVCGLVLGIMALVKGKAAGRLLAKRPADPAARDKVKLAVALGWITVAVFGLIAALG